MCDRTLVLRGSHHAGAKRVRVALPELKQLQASGVFTVAISGFDGEQLSLRLDGAAVDVGELTIDKASVASTRFDLAGDVTFRVVD